MMSIRKLLKQKLGSTHNSVEFGPTPLEDLFESRIILALGSFPNETRVSEKENSHVDSFNLPVFELAQLSYLDT